MDSQKFLIAPCGMNCGICYAYLRTENNCPGCRAEDTGKSVSCSGCLIKNCKRLATSVTGFCFECPGYPCDRLKRLDKRYRTRYKMSMIDNLAYIKANGLEAFVNAEQERWRCPNCGAVICVHYGICPECGTEGKLGIVDSISAVKQQQKLLRH